MKTSLLLCCTVGLSFPCATPASAGDAFFAPDGQSVTFVSMEVENSLMKLDLKTKNVETISLGDATKGQNISSLAGGADGEALFLTDKGAYVHDAKGTRRLCGLGAMEFATGLAAAPAKAGSIADWLFAEGVGKDDPGRRVFYCRKPGEKEFQRVFCRRVNSVSAAVFSADGRLFFGGEGDLWEGSIEAGEAGDGVATLNGTRIAPLAFMNTDMSNGGNMWVDQVMPAGNTIYVRLRGRHMGAIVSLPMNSVPVSDEKSKANGTLQEHYAYLIGSLTKVNYILTDADDITAAAAAEVNGNELVFYRTRSEGKFVLNIWDKAQGKATQVAVEK